MRLGTNIGEPTCGSEMWAMVTTLGLVYPRGPPGPGHRRPGPDRRPHWVPSRRAAAAVHLRRTAGRPGPGGGAGAALRPPGPRPVPAVGDRAGELLRPGRDRRRHRLDRRGPRVPGRARLAVRDGRRGR